MRKIIILFLFISQLQAQKIVVLDKFEPYEHIGDTLYFNRNGYDIVKLMVPVIKKTKNGPKIIRYDADYYVLINDTIDNKQMQLNEYRLSRGIQKAPEYKKFKCYAYTSTENGYVNYNNGIGRYKKIRLSGKNCDWIGSLLVDTAMERRNFKEDMSFSDNVLLKNINGGKEILDSISDMLNYIENPNFYLSIYKFDTVRANIRPYDQCSDYREISVPEGNVEDLEKFLRSYQWPILKVHNNISPYSFVYNSKYTEVSARMIERELKNGFTNSVKLFDQEDSIYALVDSFNLKTFLFEPLNKYSSYQISKHDKIISLEESLRVDINNDGYKDIVIDTIVNDVNRTVIYSPNYPKKDKSGKSRYTFGYFEQLSYTYNLGNGNYYYLEESDKDNELAFIFHLGNGKSYTFIEYCKTPIKRSLFSDNQRYRSRYRRRRRYYDDSIKQIAGYGYGLYVKNKITKRTGTRNAEKAVTMKQEAIDLFQYYIDYPEKILEDFKYKK